MATVVFGAIGAGIGSAIPGVGWKIGLQVGMALGAMYEQQQMLNRMEVGKVSDRTVSGSSYGAGLPLIWGRARLGGNVVWVARDSSGNHLVEFSSGGGKGGGPKQYRYEATCAALFCVGEMVFPDESTVHRNPSLKKLWGDDLLVYDDSAPSRYVIGSSLHYYDGGLSQSPSSVIIAKDGLASTDVCAYRCRSYAVMQDISLDDWGNRIPNWSAIIETDPVTLSDLFSDLCRMKGLAPGQIDGSLAGIPIAGASLSDGEDPLDLLMMLAQHCSCDLVEVDGALVLNPRGGSVSLTVPENELGTSVGQDQRPRVQRRRPSRRDLPSRVEVRFLDLDADLQSAVQADFRPEGSHHNTLQIDAPLALTADAAAQRAAREMDQAWEEGDELEIQLPLRRIGIAPADVINIPTARGLERCRVLKVHSDPLGEVRVTAVVESAAAFTQSSIGAAGGQVGSTPIVPVPTEFVAWSGREIQDSDQGRPGFYVTGSGGYGWQGGTIYWSPDAGSTWLVGGSITQKSAFGSALTALSASGAVADTFDTTNTVQVDVSGSGITLASASDTEVLAGKNHAVLGSEILGVGIASVVSPGVYTLSRLRRGERSTTMSGHAIADQFVLLGSGVVRVIVPDAQIGTAVQVKVVSPGQVLSDVTAKSVVIATPTPQTLDGLGVHSVPVDNLTGVLPISKGGTGQSVTPTANQMLIGSAGGGFNYTLIQGTVNQVSVAFGSGTITLAGPQDLHSGASPLFTKLGIGGALDGNYRVAVRSTNSNAIQNGLASTIIGTSTDGASRTHVGFYSLAYTVTQSLNALNQAYGGWFTTTLTHALAGITNTGEVVAALCDGSVASASHAGVLANTIGLRASHGMLSTATGGGSITASYGIRINTFLQAPAPAAIVTSYGLAITNSSSTLLPTTVYGVFENYQSALNARNYFANPVLIGTTSAGPRLRVRGLGTSSGLTALFEDSTGGALLAVRDDGAWALKGGTVATSETGWSVTNPSARRTFDTTTVTTQQLAEALGTLILALRDKGVIRS